MHLDAIDIMNDEHESPEVSARNVTYILQRGYLARCTVLSR